MTHPVVQPGHSPPLEYTDPTHHGGWIVIATAIGLTVLLFCVLIRLYVRVAIHPMAIHPITGPADCVLIAAAGFALVQSCLVFWEVSIGLGASIELVSPNHVQRLQKLGYTSDVLYLVILYLSKLAVHFLYLNFTLRTSHNRASWAVIALATVWVICSIFMIGVNCELNQPWVSIADHCTNMFLRWQLIAAFDMISDICLFLLSIYLVVDLRVPFKQKAIVVLGFGLRLPIISAAALRLHFLNTQIHSPNPTLDGVNAVIWTEIQLQYSVIACMCYCLRPFLSSLSTTYGATAVNVDVYDWVNGPSTKGYGIGRQLRSLRSKGNTYRLDPARTRTQIGGLASATKGCDEDKNTILQTPSAFNQTVVVVHEPRVWRDGESWGSNGSSRMIIEKGVDFSVRIEEAH